MIFLGFVACIALLYVYAPFPLWKSYFAVFQSVVASREIGWRPKARLLRYLLFDFAAFPFLSLAWQLDKLVVGRAINKADNALVCLVGQPRSGTTFMHRTLSNCEHFHSIRHCEMRYPFVWLWKGLRFAGLESWVRRRDYWPKTDSGALASKLHSHKLGDYEEHGIFLEERMYHHFFVFRRFPIPDLLKSVSSFANVSASEKRRLHKIFGEVVRKSKYLNGTMQKPVLLKENESVDFYEELYEREHDARFIFVVRDPDLSISSYQFLSVKSTHAKTGIDPTALTGWQEANDLFRLNECKRMIAFYEKLPKNRKLLVSYERFVDDIEGTTTAILNWLGLPVDAGFASYLSELGRKQTAREKGYENGPHRIDGLDEYKEFVRSAHSKTALVSL